MNNRKIRSKAALSTALAALITLLSLSCSQEGALMNVGAPSAGLLSGDEPVIAVRTTSVESATMEDIIVLSGEVAATGQVNILPEINGLLSRVIVSAGDRVSFNQIIAYVDPSRPGMSYAESPVRSKVSGTVTEVPVTAGNEVSTQTVIAQVGNLGSLEVETRVPEKYLAYLKNGMTARVRSRAYTDLPINAEVIEVSPVVNPQSRTIAVTLKPESSEYLRPGQSVTIDLLLDSRDNSLVVPASAVTERRNGTGVFVVDGNTVSWRKVNLGARNGGFIEIIDGLYAGELVVNAGVDAITDGSSIRVLEG